MINDEYKLIKNKLIYENMSKESGKNLERFNRSARRMCMAEVPANIYMDGIKALVDLDRAWVPDGEGKSLYIRPFLILYFFLRYRF